MPPTLNVITLTPGDAARALRHVVDQLDALGIADVLSVTTYTDPPGVHIGDAEWPKIAALGEPVEVRGDMSVSVARGCEWQAFPAVRP